MRNFTAIIEKEADSDWLVAYVPGFPGAHSQGRTMQEVIERLQEVIQMLLEDGEPQLDSHFLTVQNVQVA